MIKFTLFLFFLAGCSKLQLDDQNTHLWLEEVEGDQALTWVKVQNAKSLSHFKAHPKFDRTFKTVKKFLDSKDRIEKGRLNGNKVFNFKQTKENPKGLWRYSTKRNFLAGKRDWRVLIDVDQLAKKEKRNWVFKGSNCLPPKYQRCMIKLSDGGKDAAVQREFDVKSKSFVKNGFSIPEAKSGVTWIDRNTLFVSTNFGKGTLTKSGYPNSVRLWKRGTPLETAKEIYRGKESDVGVWPARLTNKKEVHPAVFRSMTFYTSEVFALDPNSQKLSKLAVPEDSEVELIYQGQLLISLKSSWKVKDQIFPAGALVSVNYDELKSGNFMPQILFAPSKQQSIKKVVATKGSVYGLILDNVKSSLWKFDFQGTWNVKPLNITKNANMFIATADEFNSEVIVEIENFLTPPTLAAVYPNGTKKRLQNLPTRFSKKGLTTEQFWATSKDGTKVPYFVTFKKNLNKDGKNPTILYGYGGFEISLTPYYSPSVGKNWLEEGGVYVVANIRGGGEFGPRWHQEALKTKRHKSYEDFIAVAEDLIERKITSPPHLGIRGGSNGGLLMGVMLTKRPDLFNAISCHVPLLDMLRFHKLLAGNSWIGEYGDPEKVEERKYLRSYSPYHNFNPEKNYPKIFFLTSTKDDRVHPGHARKMAKLMEEKGKPFYYYENIVGGHGGSTTNEERALQEALVYSYFRERLTQP